jgi:hypothetical protein
VKPERDKLQAILDDPHSTPEERTMAQAGLRDAIEDQPVESDVLQALLRTIGKKHLRDVSASEFARHSASFSWAERLELGRQRGEWIAPDDEILDLMGLSKLTYWAGVRNRATTADVRANAEREIKQLESGDGQ